MTKYITYITLFILVAGIFLTVSQIQKQQELRGRAFYPNGVVLTLSSLNPTLKPGDIADVYLFIDTKNLTVYEVDANLIFPANNLEIIEIINGGFLPNVSSNTFDNVAGTGRFFVGGSSLQAKKGVGVLATLKVKAVAQASAATLDFDQILTRASAIEVPGVSGGQAPNVIGALNPVTFNIVVPTVAPSPTISLSPSDTPAPPTATPTVIPTLSPTLTPTPTNSLTPTLTPAGCPIAPTLTYPVNNTSLACSYKTITLSWSKPTFATRYGIRVDDGINDIKDSRNNCSLYAVCIDDYVGNSITVNLASGRSYRWWIHASNVSCPYSAAYTFNFSVLLCPSATPTRTPTPTPTPIPITNYKISGNVYIDTNWSSTKDSGESNFANASLYIYGTINGKYQRIPQPGVTTGIVKTDSLGNYTLQVPAPGTYYMYLVLSSTYIVLITPYTSSLRSTVIITDPVTITKNFPVGLRPTGTLSADPCIGSSGTTIRWRYTNVPSAVVCRGSQVFGVGPANTDNSAFASFVTSSTSATFYLRAPYTPFKTDCSGPIIIRSISARCAPPLSCTVLSQPIDATSFKGVTTITLKDSPTINSIRWYLDGYLKGTTLPNVTEFIFSNLVTGSSHYLRSAVIYNTNQTVWCPSIKVVVQ